MPFIAAGTCEPLRIWDRLEPRTRESEFDDALAARIHDPMFLLARQWQFGEFAGEDGGSAVLATIARQLTEVTIADSGPIDGLEPVVEQVPVGLPLLARVRLGRALASRVDDAAAGLPGYDPRAARELMGRLYPPLDSAPTDPVAVAREAVNPRIAAVRAAVAGRVDATRVVAAMTGDALPPDLAAALPPEHQAAWLGALTAFAAWFAGTYALSTATLWRDDQLEYAFDAQADRSGGAVSITTAEHTGGRLDWYSSDLAATAVATGAATTTTDVRTVIPTPVSFPGMPKPRWWQFEDAAVDLGKLRADATDAARIVVSEFVLLYGNDWFVVPCRQPVGTIAECDGVIVTDVFGWRTLVGATPGPATWTDWDLFSLSPRGSAAPVAPLPQHLYLPAALGHIIDSDPVESVALVRDEGANVVWGIEQRIADETGGSRDAADTARRLRARLEPAGDEPARSDALRYVAQTRVADNWIPFVAVHRPSDTRAIRLQRSSFLREQPPGARVRPLTSILRPGVSDDDATAAPYFVNEEEVPRAGVVVSGRWRRARRFDGTPVVWHARAVTPGRGSGRGGLAFDLAERAEA